MKVVLSRYDFGIKVSTQPEKLSKARLRSRNGVTIRFATRQPRRYGLRFPSIKKITSTILRVTSM